MKKTKPKNHRMRNRITAFALSAITVFSMGTIALTATTTPVAAASIDVKEITKDLAGFGVEKIIGATVGDGIFGELLNKGAGYILGMAFDEEEPSIEDVLKKLDELSETIDSYHDDEMKQLKLINSNIDSKDFRKEADSISDDYQAAIKKMKQYSGNITTPGEGLIDNTTYRTYKNILGESSCNISALEKNFNIMVEYVKGTRSSTNHISGYRITSEYLMDKILANYKETKHDWKESPDFLDYLDSVNEEIELMESNVALDYFTILALNNMAFKVKEYEVKNGIYEVNKNENPYSYYENFARDLTNSLSSIDGIYKKVIKENNENGDFMQATAEIPTAVGGKTVKGFHTISEAWAQAYKTGKTYTLRLNGDVTADSKRGFNFDNLNKNTYQFQGNGGFHIDEGRTVTIDLGNHTLDASAKKDLIIFPMHSNSTLNISNGTLVGGQSAFHSRGRSNVTLNLKNITVKETDKEAIWYGDSIKAQTINMDGCTFENAGRIYVDSSLAKLNVKNSAFVGNQSKTSGGCFYLLSNQYPTFENCTFRNNRALDGIGGAIDAVSVIVKNCTFEGNTSEDYGKGAGGAIAAHNCKIYNSTFKNNTTDDQAGAIICIGGYSNKFTQIIDGCTFDGNTAKNVGGAVRINYIDGKRCVIKNSSFTNNHADRGPALLVERLNGHSKDIAENWGNTGSNNTATYEGFVDPRFCVPDFAWGISGKTSKV